MCVAAIYTLWVGSTARNCWLKGWWRSRGSKGSKAYSRIIEHIRTLQPENVIAILTVVIYSTIATCTTGNKNEQPNDMCMD